MGPHSPARTPLWLAVILFAAAQSARPAAAPPTNAPAAAPAKTLAAATNAPPRPAVIPILEAVVTQRRALDDNARSLRKDIEKAPPGAQRDALQHELDQLSGRIAGLENDMQSLATGIDPAAFTGTKPEAFDVQEEVIQLVRPLIEQLRRLSERPRAEESLRTAIEKAEGRTGLAERAATNAATLLSDKGLTPETRAAIQRVRDQWASRSKEAQSQLDVLRFQLQQLTARKRPVLESLTSMARRFFRVRGRNLLLALAAAVAAFLLVRRLHERARLASLPLTRHDSFYARVTNLVLHLASIVGAVVAAMLVLYFAGDWVLLGLMIVILLGLGLAARTGLSRFIEEIRILLNLGGVREGERVIFDGLPWRVDQLNFLTILTNPALPGHILRLPLWKLPSLLSRPCVEHETWFPCGLGDWVQLDDGIHGKVIALGPEFVEVVKIGGIHKTYPTAGFLAMNPASLSGGFRVATTFGIDYDHQASSTAEIPGLLHDHVYRRLVETVGRDAVRSLKVEFKQAAASSLDFEILADFDGSVAEKFETLQRALQCFAVEAANEHGWTIPFTQVTLHQAEPSTAPDGGPLTRPTRASSR